MRVRLFIYFNFQCCVYLRRVCVAVSECIQRMHPATANEKKMNKNSYLIYIILALCVCDARWYQFTRRFLYPQNEWTTHTHTLYKVHAESSAVDANTLIRRHTWRLHTFIGLNCTRINHQIKYDIFLRRSTLAALFPSLALSHCAFANRKHKQDNVSQVEFQFS